MIQGGSNKPKNHVDFQSHFYFQTPIWIAEAPMFLKNATKVTDKYIKKAEKALEAVDKQIERTLKSPEFAEYRRLPDFTKQKLN